LIKSTRFFLNFGNINDEISDYEKEIGFSIIEQAIVLVPEFEKVVRKLEQQVTLRGQSTSKQKKYIQRIALFVVHFGELPEQIDPKEINDTLFHWPGTRSHRHEVVLNICFPDFVTITGGKVTLMAKDYRDNSGKKPITLDGG